MTPQGKEALAVVDRSFTELLDKATTDQIRAKLGNLNEVCRTLVVDVGQRPTVPEVIRHYKGRFPVKGQSLAEQSLRNKRGGTNPYMALLQAWAGAAEFVLAPSRPKRHLPQPNELLSDDDVAGIVDFPLRHQVGLVLAQNRSLKAQLDILKRVGGAPMVRIAAGTEDYGPDGPLPLANDLALTDTEVESLQNFLEPRQMKARGLRRTEDGVIESMDGRRFSDPDFATALAKIVRSYRP